jgi:hypothetical protein
MIASVSSGVSDCTLFWDLDWQPAANFNLSESSLFS